MTRRVVVIGAGPAGLMAAEVAAQAGADVTVVDRMPSAGRKFLMAGRGGLNLTHAEDVPRFLQRYGPAAQRLRQSLTAFDPARLRAWSAELGQPTFVGSSGRVFPQAFKASPLLRAWLRRLDGSGVRFRQRHRWLGWTDDGALRFDTPEGHLTIPTDATVLALGGASWPRLGSDGAWADILADIGVGVAPFRPSNCGFVADWSPGIGERFAGQPLKNVGLRFGDHSARGDTMVTAQGLEGGAVYALSAVLRDAIEAQGEAVVRIALRPELTPSHMARRLRAQPPKASLATTLRKALKLAPASIAILQEARHRSGDMGPIETLVNAVPVRLTAPAPMTGAISTAGGVALASVDDQFMLMRRPGTFVAGEMLDWEAPTGGYLLQGSFSTGAAAGRGAARWLGLVGPD